FGSPNSTAAGSRPGMPGRVAANNETPLARARTLVPRNTALSMRVRVNRSTSDWFQISPAALRRFRFTWVRTSRSTALRAVAAAVTSLMPVIFTRDAIVCAPPPKGRKNAPSHTGQGRTQRVRSGRHRDTNRLRATQGHTPNRERTRRTTNPRRRNRHLGSERRTTRTRRKGHVHDLTLVLQEVVRKAVR